MHIRPRRLRQSTAMRQLVRETKLQMSDLILPLFVKAGSNIKNEISSMPGHYQLSIDRLAEEVKEIEKTGILGVILFGIPAVKDSEGSEGESANGVVQEAVREIKKISSDLLVITDVCMCEYTDHGHCGVLTPDKEVDNDKTLPHYIAQAVSHAKAGADIVAPSGNMDGMVAAIRNGLDESGFHNIPILSYAVKFASGLYGPFREAAEGAPQFGDRKTYQMDPANRHEALKEASLDVEEGTDMLMVKPASIYLDIISDIKANFPEYPLGAYHVSGEFAMIKAAAEKNLVNEKIVALETLTSIKRAGADFIITYFAKEVSEWLQS